VKYIARILVEYDDRARRVGGTGDGALAHACARAGGVERGDGAVLIPYEAVIQVVKDIAPRGYGPLLPSA
jgi:hypothetical protein